MLKILVAMAHYYKSDPSSAHGYGHDTPEQRAAIVSSCLRSLLSTFATRRESTFVDLDGNGMPVYRRQPADDWNAVQMDLAICTTEGVENLIPLFKVPSGCFRHVKVRLENPRNLGYGCLQYLRMHAGKYDYYCYLEDDCFIQDPLFFRKLAWFESMFGPEAVLLPHRYSLSAPPDAQKIFSEPELQESYIGRWMNYQKNPRLSAPFGGTMLHFVKPHNPHCGAFFLSSAQFRRYCAREENFVPTSEFVSPLESAATLGLMKTFDVYKMDFSQASFFEMEHYSTQAVGEGFVQN